MRVSPTALDDSRRVAEALAGRLDRLAGETILVTGASGFLMGFLVDVLCAWNDLCRGAPLTILALDNHRTGTPERLAHLESRTDLRFIRHDITRPLDLQGTVHNIIHGASIASPSIYRRLPLETIDANVGGTRLVLDLARRHETRGVLVMSTSEIYGDPDPAMIPTPETYRGNVSCTGPRACYDESKRMAETLATAYHQVHGVRTICIRPFNVYGPGFRLDDQRVLPDFMSAVLARRPIELLSDGVPTRTFSYVTDAARAMLLLLLDGFAGEAYNVGNDQGEISMLDLARLVARIAPDIVGGEPVDVRFRTSADPQYLADNPNRRCPEISKLMATIDWRPEMDLEVGLRRMLTSYAELGLVTP